MAKKVFPAALALLFLAAAAYLYFLSGALKKSAPSSPPPVEYVVSSTTVAAYSQVYIALLDPGNKYPPYKTRGCDNVVLLPTPLAATTTPLTAALKELLSIRNVWTGGSGDLYDFLAKGNLSLDRVTLQGGTANIYLTGTLPTPGGVCDDPRLESQIEETAFQFPAVIKVNIFINGKPYISPNEKG